MTDIPRSILAGWKVVIMDDEPDSLELASLILNMYQAEVHTATNGEEGLTLIKEIRPDFIISDLSMPVMDGWEVIAKVQKDPALREIPVIALTAHAMMGDRERALAAGFYNYLTKPLTAKTFINDLLSLLTEVPEFAGEFEW